MLRQLVLEGSLAQFGGPFTFDVASVQEAVHALTTQIKGTYRAIRQGEFLVFADDVQLEENETGFDLGTVSRIRIVPVPVGSKSNGVFKVILGVALLGVGLAVGAGGLALGTLGTISQGTFFMMSAGFLLNGIGQMLSPSPSMSIGDSEKADSKTSYLFSSAVNVCEEGNCVPVVYGKAYCGSIVVSSGQSVDDVDITLDNVTGLSVTGGYNRITASWTAVSGAHDYQVKWTGTEDGSMTTTSTSGSKYGLAAGNYTVSVQARNGSITSKNWASANVTVEEYSGSDGYDDGGGCDDCDSDY